MLMSKTKPLALLLSLTAASLLSTWVKGTAPSPSPTISSVPNALTTQFIHRRRPRVPEARSPGQGRRSTPHADLAQSSSPRLPLPRMARSRASKAL